MTPKLLPAIVLVGADDEEAAAAGLTLMMPLVPLIVPATALSITVFAVSRVTTAVATPLGEHGRRRHIDRLTVVAGQRRLAGEAGGRVAVSILGRDGDVEAGAGRRCAGGVDDEGDRRSRCHSQTARDGSVQPIQGRVRNRDPE